MVLVVVVVVVVVVLKLLVLLVIGSAGVFTTVRRSIRHGASLVPASPCCVFRLGDVLP